jgi:hypothetical protein
MLPEPHLLLPLGPHPQVEPHLLPPLEQHPLLLYKYIIYN